MYSQKEISEVAKHIPNNALLKNTNSMVDLARNILMPIKPKKVIPEDHKECENCNGEGCEECNDQGFVEMTSDDIEREDYNNWMNEGETRFEESRE